MIEMFMCLHVQRLARRVDYRFATQIANLSPNFCSALDQNFSFLNPWSASEDFWPARLVHSVRAGRSVNHYKQSHQPFLQVSDT